MAKMIKTYIIRDESGEYLEEFYTKHKANIVFNKKYKDVNKYSLISWERLSPIIGLDELGCPEWSYEFWKD